MTIEPIMFTAAVASGEGAPMMRAVTTLTP
jgi:hypothetical protein